MLGHFCFSRRRWATAVALLVAFLLAGCGGGPALRASISTDTISPNEDGISDSALFQIRVSKDAMVGIELRDAAGMSYIFRAPTSLGASRQPHSLVFDGLISGSPTYQDCAGTNTLRRRLLPNGIYTWIVTALDPQNATETVSVSGTISVVDADEDPGLICGFSVYPAVFSPNQDGIDDRATVNMALSRDVESIRVYLIGPEGDAYDIPEAEGLSRPGQRGWHTFDYDGGIDAGISPPANGPYMLVAQVRDRLGQVAEVTSTLTVEDAGLPRAYIQNADATYNRSELGVHETLCYSVTVTNESDVPLRTAGPWSGATYASGQNFNTLGWSEESGAFRVGLDCESSLRNYPYRWGLGQPEGDLVHVGTYWYLPPRARTVVSGCVTFEAMPTTNPQYCWVGLIHEDVEILAANDRVDPLLVTIQSSP